MPQNELNNIREIRAQKISEILTCFDALKYLRRITSNCLPEFINR